MEPLIQDPMSVAGFLAALVAGIFWLSGRPSLEKLFERWEDVKNGLLGKD